MNKVLKYEPIDIVELDKNINNQQIRKSNKTFTEEPAQNYVSDPNL